MSYLSISMTFTSGGTGGKYRSKITYEELPTPVIASKNESGSRALINYLTFGSLQANRDYARIYHFNTTPTTWHDNMPPHTSVYRWRRTA